MRTRRPVARYLFGALVAAGQPAWAAQVQIAVITSPAEPRLSFDRDMLRNVYLKRIFVDDDGLKLTPVNLPTDAPLRDAFSRTIVRMPAARLQDYWDKQYFQGVSPPYVLGSDGAVVRFVAATPGAIGYVASCHVDASVHVVMLLPWPAGMTNTPALCPDRAGP